VPVDASGCVLPHHTHVVQSGVPYQDFDFGRSPAFSLETKCIPGNPGDPETNPLVSFPDDV
jgi:hypothetical protein